MAGRIVSCLVANQVAGAASPATCPCRPVRSAGRNSLLKTSSGALNTDCAVLPDMTESYEPPADRRPWQAHHPGPGDHSPGQDFGLGPDLNLGEAPAPPPQQPSSAAFGPADWAALDPYSSHANDYVPGGGHLERRPANWPAYEPYPTPPALPSQPPYPTQTAPFWRQGWADYDPRSGYPVWPGHPAYAARNAGLRRLSKLTWRAAEVSAVVAVGFVALFARIPHSTTSHAGAQQSGKPSIHAAATHHGHKRHKPKHHHHHHSGAPATALAPPNAPPGAAPAAAPPQAAPPPPPAAAPQPPPPPPPAPPPPPTTTSGGSGGGG